MSLYFHRDFPQVCEMLTFSEKAGCSTQVIQCSVRESCSCVYACINRSQSQRGKEEDREGQEAAQHHYPRCKAETTTTKQQTEIFIPVINYRVI